MLWVDRGSEEIWDFFFSPHEEEELNTAKTEAVPQYNVNSVTQSKFNHTQISGNPETGKTKWTSLKPGWNYCTKSNIKTITIRNELMICNYTGFEI